MEVPCAILCPLPRIGTVRHSSSLCVAVRPCHWLVGGVSSVGSCAWCTWLSETLPRVHQWMFYLDMRQSLLECCCHPWMKAWAYDLAESSSIGWATKYLVFLLMAVSTYLKPLDMGSGPATSVCTTVQYFFGISKSWTPGLMRHWLLALAALLCPSCQLFGHFWADIPFRDESCRCSGTHECEAVDEAEDALSPICQDQGPGCFSPAEEEQSRGILGGNFQTRADDGNKTAGPSVTGWLRPDGSHLLCWWGSW